LKELNKEERAAWNRILFRGIVLLLSSPAIYLCIASLLIKPERDIVDGSLFIVFVLLAIAAPPLFKRFVERHLVENSLKQGKSLAETYQVLSITRFATVSLSYIFGFFSFVMFGDWWRMLLLFAVGVMWTVKCWPRRREFEEFLETHREPTEQV